MRLDDFRAKWRTLGEDFKRFRAHVDGALLVDEVLRDFEAVSNAEAEEMLTLSQAAAETGFDADHLGRLIRQGKLRNHGRRGAPRVRRGDLPRKAHGRSNADGRLTGTALESKAQIARAVVTSFREGNDG